MTYNVKMSSTWLRLQYTIAKYGTDSYKSIDLLNFSSRKAENCVTKNYNRTLGIENVKILDNMAPAIIWVILKSHIKQNILHFQDRLARLGSIGWPMCFRIVLPLATPLAMLAQPWKNT